MRLELAIETGRATLGVMAGHSRLNDGVAEPVIGTRDFARSRWLAYDPGTHEACRRDTLRLNRRTLIIDCRVKPGNDNREVGHCR